jgi:uncharacterized protein YcbK (DUF882 family)
MAAGLPRRTSPEESMLSRRIFLRHSGLAVAGLALAPKLAWTSGAERRLSFLHTHTGERLSVAYAVGERYLADGLKRVNHVLRDFRSGEAFPIDPALLDLLHRLSQTTGTASPFHVISGFRSPGTNAMLRSRSNGVAGRSLHMTGKAVDIRLPGVTLTQLRDAATALRRGGVGFYPESDFVHVDTGRVRSW